MKKIMWIVQLPLILAATAAFQITEMGSQGNLTNPVLREKVFPVLRSFSGQFTDLKFKMRGPVPPKNKIVVIEVDSPSIDAIGRWPWHRDAISLLIDETYKAGAKVVGLDMVFSEPDKRIPEELEAFLKERQLADIVPHFETDLMLENLIRSHADTLVLGYTSEGICPPGLDGLERCPVTAPEALAMHQPGFPKFAIGQMNMTEPFNQSKTPVLTMVTMLPNIQSFSDAARHAGYFNAFPDVDGYIRRSNLALFADGKAYPSLPLEMARIGLNEELQITLSKNDRISEIGFFKSGRKIPVNALGEVEVNFRGGDRTFPYVSALDILRESDTIADEVHRKLAGVSKKELLKDAYVLIGVSALGVFDMRSFPFGSNIAGVEGHANILDNLLSDDFLTPGRSSWHGGIWMLLLMTVGALAFGYMTQRLESVPALLLFIGVFVGFGAIDMKLLFQNNYNLNTSFLVVEMFSIFLFTMIVKYVVEERNKKFLRSAFTKYVSPTLVDTIIKDPSKLSLGGERKDLTIMFSDIRSFTTFSEQMDAKSLAAFLNDYLGIMTKIVFKHNGTLDKYIGDAVMAFWGAPLDNPKHAIDACKAGAEMMEALAANRDRWKQQWGVTVNVGLGINSGSVSVGNMGSDTNFEYTVIGDNVNLASRLEGLTKAYGVTMLTTRFTFDSVMGANESLPPHRILDFVKVKGKKKAVELIQLHEKEPHPDALRLWNEGRELYTQQQWDAAIEKFEACNRLMAVSPDEPDGPCAEFIQRCRDFKNEGPGEAWDGSWEMHSK